MKIVALAGGVGGAKLAAGLAQVLPPENLTIIVNTGDDFEHLGLRICPDLDTVCYTLAGLANPVTGWGRVDETWNAFENVAQLGGPDWFRLGDRDLGTHLERTRRIREGQPLSQITRDFCQSWGIGPKVLPMSDHPIPTIVLSDEGELPFQEYFVHRGCQPVVRGFRFEGVGESTPSLGVTSAIQNADLVVICPSNPWVSIDPILAIPGIREALTPSLVLPSPTGRGVGGEGKIVAVSPIIGGQAVKGPVVKMYAELGIQPSALAVAQHYGDLLDGFVFDIVDAELEKEVKRLNVETLCVQTLMKTPEDRKNLALAVLKFGERLLSDTM